MGTKGSRIHEKWNLLYMKSKTRLKMTRFFNHLQQLKRGQKIAKEIWKYVVGIFDF